jgi:hypothetical protein
MASHIVSQCHLACVPEMAHAVRPAAHHAPGIRTFYIASGSKPGVQYTVQHIRRRGMRCWQCSCPQFFYRCVARRRHCKHIHFVRRGAATAVLAA